ncbi:hypothetical protein Drorol1_Dr00027091 [Drosera rotundifolia]
MDGWVAGGGEGEEERRRPYPHSSSLTFSLTLISPKRRRRTTQDLSFMCLVSSFADGIYTSRRWGTQIWFWVFDCGAFESSGKWVLVVERFGCSKAGL